MIALDFNRRPFSPDLPMLFNQASCSALFDKIPEEENYKRGEVIFWDGRQTSRHVYLVRSGIVKLSSAQQQKELLEDYYQAGELFNYQPALGRPDLERTAIAMVSNTIVKKLPMNMFQQALRSNHELYEDVLGQLSASLQRTQDRLLRLTLYSAQRRVYHFLARHALKSGRKVGFEYVIKPVLTHQEIGNIAGVGRQTVTTVLNELRRDGVIHFNRRYLIVRDLDALLQLAQTE